MIEVMIEEPRTVSSFVKNQEKSSFCIVSSPFPYLKPFVDFSVRPSLLELQGMRSIMGRCALFYICTSFSMLFCQVDGSYLGAPCFGGPCDNGLACLTVSGDACTSMNRLETLCTCGGVGKHTSSASVRH